MVTTVCPYWRGRVGCGYELLEDKMIIEIRLHANCSEWDQYIDDYDDDEYLTTKEIIDNIKKDANKIKDWDK